LTAEQFHPHRQAGHGVTSIVRALNLRPSLYTKLLDHFHSSVIELDRLSATRARRDHAAAARA
jgi:hypothetical protein